MGSKVTAVVAAIALVLSIGSMVKTGVVGGQAATSETLARAAKKEVDEVKAGSAGGALKSQIEEALARAGKAEEGVKNLEGKLQGKPAAATQKLQLTFAERAIQAATQTGGHSHASFSGFEPGWQPDTLVVFKGDKVDLEVINTSGHFHSLTLPDYNVDTGKIPGKGGMAMASFTADKAGVFQWRCGVEQNAAANECEPNHKYQTGYLVVLDR